MGDKRSLRAPLALLAAAVAVVAYAGSGLSPQVRFVYVPLNYWAAAGLACLLPIAIFWASLRATRRASRLAGIAVSVVVAVPALVFAVLAWVEGSSVANNIDTSFELLSEGTAGHASYRLYRTNCGATCAFGLALRKERDLPLGIRLVTPVWSLDRSSEGAVEVHGSAVRVVSGDRVLATVER